MYGLSGNKKIGRCRKVAFSGSLTVTATSLKRPFFLVDSPYMQSCTSVTIVSFFYHSSHNFPSCVKLKPIPVVLVFPFQMLDEQIDH